MQLECPQICGLCDNHDLQRSEKVEASIKAVERSSIAEFERLQAAFRKVLPAVRLGASHTHPDGDPALLQEAPLWGDEWADTVIFVTVTIGFLDFFQNWRETARRAGISRFMVIAEDAKVYERLKSHTSDVAHMSVHVPAEKAVVRAGSANAENEGMGGALPYSSAAYKSLVNRRPRYIRALLSLGVNVVYSDIDTVWMRSPFRGFIGNHTMWIQSVRRHAHPCCVPFSINRCRAGHDQADRLPIPLVVYRAYGTQTDVRHQGAHAGLGARARHTR